jgi:hypothetical protein
LSWLSSGIKGIGHLAEKAAPYVGMIPGVGTLAGGVIGGLGGLAAGDGLGGALKYGAEGAAGGLAGGGVRSALSGFASRAMGGGSPAPGGGVPNAGGGPAGGSYDPSGDALYGTDTTPGAPPSDGSGIGGYLKGALGGINPLTGALAGAEVVNAGQLGSQANKYASDAYGSAAGSYAERAGLRAKGIAGMMNPTTPDLSNLTAIRGRNPYSAPQQPAPVPSAPPQAGGALGRLQLARAA